MVKVSYALAGAALFSLLLGPSPASAERVGVNSAVNQGATGTPPNAATHQLIIGGNVLYQERIATGAKGQTQILFVDQSTMSVGPNSNLVIDRFVYNPHTGGGKMVANLAHGIFRYVGGQLARHDNAVQMTTPSATIGIRGGIVLVKVADSCPPGTAAGQGGSRSCGLQVIFVYGKGVTVTAKNGAAKTMTRPGSEITVARPGASPSVPFTAPSEFVGTFLVALDGRSGATGGASVIPTEPMVVASGVPAVNSEDFQASVQAAQTATLAQPPTGQIQPVSSSPSWSTPSPSQPSSPTPQPPPVNSPILPLQSSSSQSQPAVVAPTTQTTPAPTPTPTPTPPPVGITYAGVFKNTAGQGSFLDQGTLNGVPARVAYNNGLLTSGIFTVNLSGAGPLSIPLAPGSATLNPAATASPLGPVGGTSFMTADGTFFYADLTPINQPNEREFIDGGLPVGSSFYGATGQTRFFAFDLQPDAALQSTMPFLPAGLAGPTVSPLYLVASPATAFGASNAAGLLPTRALQASLAINGQGTSQNSAIAIAVGAVGPNGGASPALSGVVRGSSLASAGGSPQRVDAGLASVLDGNQNSFYGGTTISGFALAQTGSGAETVPLSPTGTPSIYGFTQPALAGTLPAGIGSSRSGIPLTGYFGGLMNTTADPTPYTVAGLTALAFDPVDNHVLATFIGNDPLTASTSTISAIRLNFGDATDTGTANNAYIDDNVFAAAESTQTPQQIDGQNLVVGGSTAAAARLYLLSSGAAAPPASLLPAGASYCSCQYLKWGYWGGDLLSGSATGTTISRIDRGHLNFWEAGPQTPFADLQTLAGSSSPSATYAGHLIGSVFNNGAQYTAAGGLQMIFNFATLDGTFQVTNYDGATFTQAIPSQSINTGQYSFPITQNGFSGGANGAFYGPQAAETGGNFYWHNPAQTYITSGIFAGVKQ